MKVTSPKYTQFWLLFEEYFLISAPRLPALRIHYKPTYHGSCERPKGLVSVLWKKSRYLKLSLNIEALESLVFFVYCTECVFFFFCVFECVLSIRFMAILSMKEYFLLAPSQHILLVTCLLRDSTCCKLNFFIKLWRYNKTSVLNPKTHGKFLHNIFFW